jgi:thermitase
MIHAADQGYQVINMSFGGPSASQAEADAAAYAWNAGALLVSSAGNSYTSAPGYPAAFAEVIAVAATDWHDNLGSFSNFGSWVSLSAPGHQVFSTMPYAACGLPDTDPEGCYGWLSGTSMASPRRDGSEHVGLDPAWSPEPEEQLAERRLAPASAPTRRPGRPHR